MSQPFFFDFYLLGIIHLRFAEADEPERLNPESGKKMPEIIILPNAGHMAHWEATAEVVRGGVWVSDTTD